MRIKDINEKDDDNKVRSPFMRGVAKGWQATQKGGILAPDSFEKGIKKFFTDPGKDPDDDSKNEKPKKVKGGGGTADTVAKQSVRKDTPTKPTAEPTAKPKEKPAAPSKGEDFPMGYAGGEKYKVKPGDIVDYTNANGKELQAKVTKLLDTRDKDGDLQIELSLKGALYALDRKKITKVNGKDWKFTESKEETMNKAIKEGLADLAGKAEADHEVQMARADLYKIAKYAIKLHDMLKDVTEERGMEGWQQAKITKAADYIGSVYHNLDYDMKFGDQSDEIGPDAEMQMGESRDTHCSDKCCGADVKREDCTCPPDCKHCNCNATNVDEGKYKNDAQRKAVHASKAKKDKYKESIAEKLKAKLEASVTPPSKPASIKAKSIKSKNIKPNTGGH